MDATILLGKIIKDYMDARYIKLNKLASGLGVSSDIVAKMLNGKRKISAVEYLRICDILEVKPGYFKDLMDNQISGSANAKAR